MRSAGYSGETDMRAPQFPTRLLACLLSWLGLVNLCRADAFDDAARLYERGQASEAASAYEDLLQAKGPSFPLLYNLGNAHFRAGNAGKALWAYREAEHLNPWDSDTQANISTVLVHFNLPQPKGFVESTIRHLPLGTTGWITLGLTAATSVLMTFSLWNPGLYQRTTSFRWLAGIASVVAWSAYSTALWNHFTGPNAIVIARDASVRHGPLEEAPAAYPAPDGSELRIIGIRREWYHVKDASGRQGWIAQIQLKRLMP